MSATFSIALLGGGRLALRLTQLLARSPLEVRVWARSAKARAELAALKAPNAEICERMEEACHAANVVFFCVPAFAMEDVAEQYAPHARADHVVLHACRGVGRNFTLPSDSIRGHTCVRRVGVLGGPIYFGDVQHGRPVNVVLGSRFEETFEAARTLVAGTPVRLHTTMDLVGVEVAGAISNVTTLAVGMADELGLGETARGVLLTRGLTEAARVGAKVGADAATFSGLAGVGDLIPREVSSNRRHREVGALLARGLSLEEALGKVEGAVEGVTTAQEVEALVRHHRLKLPLLTAVAEVLRGRVTAAGALDGVLSLDLGLDALHVPAARG